MARIGIIPLARPTFDIAFARELAESAINRLYELGHICVFPDGPKFEGVDLITDNDLAFAAIDSFKSQTFDLLLILQTTFTDAEALLRITDAIKSPVAIWAFPEPRAGGRLRLNSFCGLNLAAHALGRAEVPYSTLFAPPDEPALPGLLGDILAGSGANSAALEPVAYSNDNMEIAGEVADSLRDMRVGIVGKHPPGFVTCAYDTAVLKEDTGISVDAISLDTMFERADAADSGEVEEARQHVVDTLQGAEFLDQKSLTRSMRVLAALDSLRNDRGLSALAVRCWPEMFTEYGCAACGPMAMMIGSGTPAACEADVYGAVTALMLQGISKKPALLVDIVDMSDADDTGVFWHCGLAPTSMASSKTPPAAGIHSNRRLPLLHDFALKPGRVTIARLSQSKNIVRLVIGGGDMIEAPNSFSGTSGVIRFDRPVADVRQRLLDEGLEHHVAFTYGEHRAELAALAARLDLPTLTLC
ncbi:MAG: hypothetical protein AAGA88_10065 [Pseudomonadota bacterium]